MTLIRCDSDCIYQKDGYCANDTQNENTDGLNFSLNNGCIYYRKNIQNKTICLEKQKGQPLQKYF